ncbi:hypothetical protein BGZ98_003848, partial [Dissophora globulifera]
KTSSTSQGYKQQLYWWRDLMDDTCRDTYILGLQLARDNALQRCCQLEATLKAIPKDVHASQTTLIDACKSRDAALRELIKLRLAWEALQQECAAQKRASECVQEAMRGLEGTMEELKQGRTETERTVEKVMAERDTLSKQLEEVKKERDMWAKEVKDIARFVFEHSAKDDGDADTHGDATLLAPELQPQLTRRKRIRAHIRRRISEF